MGPRIPLPQLFLGAIFAPNGYFLALIILSLAAGFILNMATESVLLTIGPPYNS